MVLANTKLLMQALHTSANAWQVIQPQVLQGQRSLISRLLRQHFQAFELLADDPKSHLSRAAAQWKDLLWSSWLESVATLIGHGKPLNSHSIRTFDIVIPLKGQKVIALQASTPLGGQRKYGIPVA